MVALRAQVKFFAPGKGNNEKNSASEWDNILCWAHNYCWQRETIELRRPHLLDPVTQSMATTEAWSEKQQTHPTLQSNKLQITSSSSRILLRVAGEGHECLYDLNLRIRHISLVNHPPTLNIAIATKIWNLICNEGNHSNSNNRPNQKLNRWNQTTL